MPQLFVVTNQKTVRAIATKVLARRTSASTRDKAIAAIRRANPNLDLDRLSPGDVVVIPAVTGLRRGADDPVGDGGDDLAARVRDGLASLSSAAEQGEEQRAADKQEAQALFQSAALKRLSSVEPLIAEYVEANRARFRQDDVEAKRQLGELRSAAAGWSEDLDALRELL
jgi:hypothetical protein